MRDKIVMWPELIEKGGPGGRGHPAGEGGADGPVEPGGPFGPVVQGGPVWKSGRVNHSF
jgi:hypothetical protein